MRTPQLLERGMVVAGNVADRPAEDTVASPLLQRSAQPAVERRGVADLVDAPLDLSRDDALSGAAKDVLLPALAHESGIGKTDAPVRQLVVEERKPRLPRERHRIAVGITEQRWQD